VTARTASEYRGSRNPGLSGIVPEMEIRAMIRICGIVTLVLCLLPACLIGLGAIACVFVGGRDKENRYDAAD
jgi:predicted benzoate:H+ symporter BenE